MASRSKVVIATYLCASRKGFPFDLGDDPSFAASARTGGPLTWGVCRTDVRNSLKKGDLVVFFAGEQGPLPPRRYWYVGYATVARFMRQSSVWTSKKGKPFRAYKNLLIRPGPARSFEWFEPHDAAQWHGDWLWRLTRTPRAKRKAYELAGRRGIMDEETVVAGKKCVCGNNYVVFEPEGTGTKVLGTPPLVATWKRGKRESWTANGLARALKGIVLRGSRLLRTRNTQQPHRHIAIKKQDCGAWRQQLDEFARAFGLRHRRNGARRAGRVRPRR